MKLSDSVLFEAVEQIIFTPKPFCLERYCRANLDRWALCTSERLVLRTFLDQTGSCHDDVIKWKHFPRYWPFVRGNHRSPVNSPHKDQCRGALMFTLICARINGWVNNREAGDLRRHRAHYDVIVMAKSWSLAIYALWAWPWAQY